MQKITAARGVPSISQQIGDIAAYLERAIQRHMGGRFDAAQLLQAAQSAQRALRLLEFLARDQESRQGLHKERQGIELG